MSRKRARGFSDGAGGHPGHQRELGVELLVLVRHPVRDGPAAVLRDHLLLWHAEPHPAARLLNGQAQHADLAQERRDVVRDVLLGELRDAAHHPARDVHRDYFTGFIGQMGTQFDALEVALRRLWSVPVDGLPARRFHPEEARAVIRSGLAAAPRPDGIVGRAYDVCVVHLARPGAPGAAVPPVQLRHGRAG